MQLFGAQDPEGAGRLPQRGLQLTAGAVAESVVTSLKHRQLVDTQDSQQRFIEPRFGAEAEQMVEQAGTESVALDAAALGRLEFNWIGDRFAHRWDFGEAGLAIVSQESDGLTVWPTSPPLQQIHHQSFADGREVLFGVGMSGRGHWSASYTMVPELRCWIVELACRTPIKPERLSSSYALLGAWQFETRETAAGATQAVSAAVEQQQLVLEAILPATRGVEREGQICFEPASLTWESTTTIQWAFKLKLV